VQKDKPPILIYKGFDTQCPDNAKAQFKRLESGNINVTWLVSGGADSQHPGGPDFVLQQINSHVFVDPHKIAEQIHGVSAFLNHKIPGFVPRCVPSVSGMPWVDDDAGGIWKMSRYVHDTQAVNRINSAPQAECIARAYGQFQYLLRDFKLPIDDSPVKHFHQLAPHLEAFHYLALVSERALAAQNLTGSISRLISDWVPSIDAGLMHGERKAVIHGDCKVNNVLLSSEGDCVRAIVDLDTVMYGERGWDFGDLVRSGANALGEDADNPGYSPDFFKAIAKGFVGALQDILSIREKEQMVCSCQYMTFMLAVRFLVDYLDGDKYFTVQDNEQNLRRATAQFRLFEQMRAHEAEMLVYVRSL
jgi:hypothetical protein